MDLPSVEGDDLQAWRPMKKAVEFDATLRLNADQLEQSLSRQHALLSEITDDEERTRRADAMAQISNYVGMLRDAGRPSGSFSFKLELLDGRWDVEERDMPAEPRLGDVLSFHGIQWFVRTSQIVKPRPAGRPARTVFVCAPFA
jgi:hypothetical protein